MFTIVKDFKIELANDTIMIKDAKTGDLFRAKTFKASEVLDKYNSIVKSYKEKLGA